MQKIIKQSGQTKSLNVIDNKTIINEILDTSTARSVTLSEQTEQIAACSCSACVAQAQAANVASEDASAAASTSTAAAETEANVTTYTLSIGDGDTTIRYPKENIKLVFDGVDADEATYELIDSTSGTLVITYGNGDTVTFENFFSYDASFEVQFDDIVLDNKAFLDAANVQYWVKNLSVGRVADTEENIVYYCFSDTQPDYVNLETSSYGLSNWQSFQTYQRELVEQIFSSIEDSVNIRFVETNTPNQANTISFQNVDIEKGYLGFAYYPSGSNLGSDVFINSSLVSEENAASGYNSRTYTHEILHALGLTHPFETYDEDLITAEKVTPWTVMSYSRAHPQQAYIKKLLDADMAALQALYGVNENARTGNDTYTFDNSIGQLVWDGAGTDTIDASKQTDKVTINLNDGAWSYVGNARAENISEGNQLSININTTIENAKGGSGNDTLIGNEADNALYGKDGNDKLYGGKGNDMLFGNNGQDKLYGGDGNDRLYDYNGNNWLYGEAGDDTLHAGDGNDWLHGGNDNDKLYGRGGKDFLSGGDGNDYLRGGLGDDRLYGGNDDDTLIGDAGDDYLYGNSGDDFIRGDAGNNHLYGSSGNDRLYGGDDVDTLYGGSGDDNLRGGDGDDSLYGDNGNDHLLGHDGNDTLYGHYGNDYLNGGNGNDSLYGDSGDDYLSGGAGDDYLSSGTGLDRLLGGSGNDTFAFNSFSSTTPDKIYDFVGANDVLQLDQDVFSQLNNGSLRSYNFAANSTGTAKDSNDFVIYNTSSGTLSYDADGNGSGAAYTFVTLTNHAALTYNDIVIV